MDPHKSRHTSSSGAIVVRMGATGSQQVRSGDRDIKDLEGEGKTPELDSVANKESAGREGGDKSK